MKIVPKGSDPFSATKRGLTPFGISDWLEWGENELSFLGKTGARLECRRILEFVSSLRGSAPNEAEAISRIEGLLRRPDGLLAMTGSVPCADEERFQTFSSLIRQRKKRTPLAYLLGETYFWDGRFQVEPGVLIPRPETETLIEAFLNHGAFEKGDAFRFLDLGTGSGIIAATVAGLFPKAKGVASDISWKALEVARKNSNCADVRTIGISGTGPRRGLSLVQADGLSAFRPEAFDVIFSNPPYVSSEDWETLEPEVRREPRLALDGGEDGLDFYRRIPGELDCLKRGGSLWVEVGAGQAGIVKMLFEEAGFKETRIFKDLNGIERVVAGIGFNRHSEALPAPPAGRAGAGRLRSG